MHYESWQFCLCIIIIIIIFQLINSSAPQHLFPFLPIIFSLCTAPVSGLSLVFHFFILSFSLTPFPLTLSPSIFLWSFTISPSLSLPVFASLFLRRALVTQLTFPQHGCQTQLQHLSSFTLPFSLFLSSHLPLFPHLLGLKKSRN